jgi:hypothetical protein
MAASRSFVAILLSISLRRSESQMRPLPCGFLEPAYSDLLKRAKNISALDRSTVSVQDLQFDTHRPLFGLLSSNTLQEVDMASALAAGVARNVPRNAFVSAIGGRCGEVCTI